MATITERPKRQAINWMVPSLTPMRSNFAQVWRNGDV
jgi:hypothetical protein